MKTRILIVDDEPGVLEVLNQYLTGEGYDCVTTTSPLEALDLIRRDKFIVLITDVLMPEMNGIEVLRQAKEHDEQLAVIVITVVMEVGRAIDAVRGGADDYVLKPFNLGEISTALNKVLQKRGMASEYRQHQEKLEARIEGAAEELDRVTRELRDTKEYLEGLLHSTLDPIFATDAENRIEFVNDGFIRTLGYSKEEAAGKDVAEIYPGAEEEVTYLRRQLSDRETLQNYDTELRRQDGQLVPVNVTLSLVHAVEGGSVSILAVCKDVTEQKRLQQELKEMSLKDSLTGLYNHRHFFDRLEAEIERAKRQAHPLSLLLIDVDKFKGYNDSHGHLEGDEALKGVGRVVRECTRDHVDFGFRYGGDEFTVILPEADREPAWNIAERIRHSYASLPYGNLTLSIGLITHQEGSSMRSFIQSADAMMYEAKRSGGNRVFVYDPQSVEEATPEKTSEV